MAQQKGRNRRTANENQDQIEKEEKEMETKTKEEPAIKEAVITPVPKFTEVEKPVVGEWYEFEDGTIKEYVGPTAEQMAEALAEAEAKEAESKADEAKLTEGMPAEADNDPEKVKEGIKLVESNYAKTKSGYKHQVKIALQEGVILEIMEYGGYITDVRVKDNAGKEIYRSEKMSLKDTLDHLEYTGDREKLAKRQIIDLRKAAKTEAEAKLAAAEKKPEEVVEQKPADPAVDQPKGEETDTK